MALKKPISGKTTKVDAEPAAAAEAEPLSRRHLRIFQEHENQTGRPHRHKRAAIATYGGWSSGTNTRNTEAYLGANANAGA